MISDWELWACAKHMLKQHGDAAPAHIASRIAALTAAGDAAGVRTWQAIGSRLQRLTEPAHVEQTRH